MVDRLGTHCLMVLFHKPDLVLIILAQTLIHLSIPKLIEILSGIDLSVMMVMSKHVDSIHPIQGMFSLLNPI